MATLLSYKKVKAGEESAHEDMQVVFCKNTDQMNLAAVAMSSADQEK